MAEHNIMPVDSRTNRFTLRQYFEAMRRYKTAALLTAVCFSLTTICFGAVLPFILAHAIDLVGHHQKLELGGTLANTLFLGVGVAAFGAVSNGIGSRGFARLDSRAQNYIRTKVFDRLMHENAAFYANTMTGSLTSNVVAYTNGYSVIQEVVFQRGLNLFLPLIAGVCIVATQSLLLAGLFVIIACVIAVKTLFDSRTRAPLRYKRRAAMNELNGFVGDVISNNATVRMFAGERHEKRNLFQKQHTWQVAAQANLHVFGRHYSQLVGSINVLQVAGISVAAWLATTGRISLGLVVFAISYFQRLSSGLLEFGPLVQTYQMALMDAAPISEILMTKAAIVDVSNATKLNVNKGTIELRAVTYRYENDAAAVFEKLSLRIPGGQSVGLVGRSGGGKTTLTNLLLRAADVEAGSVMIDGQSIAEATQRSLRESISYIPQDSHLFHRSIRENIAYGKPKASDQEIIAAAKEAHIWELIQSLPAGLDTKVGERGMKLSGGQRQRVAIARAILKDAPILIFDEATSALDSESEQHIQASLDELMKGRTTIVIAHRLSTIQKMDRIIVMDKGQVIEDGTHAQLVKKKGLYASLWTHQSGGFIED